MLKDFLTALSLSNLCFISVWQMLLVQHPSGYPFYHWKVHPGPLLLAVVLDVLLVACIFWVAMLVARRNGNPGVLRVARYAFMLTLLIPLFYFLPNLHTIGLRLSEDVSALWRFGDAGTSLIRVTVLVIIICGVGFVAVAVILVRTGRSVIPFVAKLVLILSPLAFVWSYQAITIWLKSPSQFGAAETVTERGEQGVRLQPENAQPKARVVWVIFDELDFRLSFPGRPDSLQLPEFDRLHRSAFFALNAYPPSGDTVLSLPAFLSGKLVSDARRVNHDDMMLKFGGEDEARWSTVPSVFTRAREAGYRTEIAGWYHPYCRILRESVDLCSWETASQLGTRDPETIRLISSTDRRELGKSMLSLFVKVAWTVPPSGFFRPSEAGLVRQYQILEFARLEERGMQMVSDPSLGLGVIHMPIPHPAGIYDRSTQKFSEEARSGYLDNLALADRTLRRLREEMEKAGLWDRTYVLVTSDHSLRTERVWRTNRLWLPPVTEGEENAALRGEDHRIPFIVKLAGQTEGFEYNPSFNAVLSQDLALAMLRGELKSAENISAWLDANRTIGESPYLEGDK